MSHTDELELLIKERNIDVLCISETWLDSGIRDSFIDIPDFNVYRNNHGRGGGVCIYVRNDVKVKCITPNTENVIGIEDIWITIQHKKLPSLIIGCIYRHPKALTCSFDYIKTVLKEMCMRKKPIFVLGDMNDDLLSTKNKLSGIIHQLNLYQTIENPTRITSTSKTLLDVIITNKLEMVLKSEVVPCPIADHELITIKVNLEKPKRQPVVKTFRSLKNYHANRFCDNLFNRTIDFNLILDTDNVGIQVDIFTKTFLISLDECAPFITQEISRPPAPWISQDLKAEMKARDELQKRSKQDRTNIALGDLYRTEKKGVSSMLEGVNTLSKNLTIVMEI